jgi:hypothetical protein
VLEALDRWAGVQGQKLNRTAQGSCSRVARGQAEDSSWTASRSKPQCAQSPSQSSRSGSGARSTYMVRLYSPSHCAL